MASTTATAFIGGTHQNDLLICPTHVARLIEGDAACWVLNSLHRPARPTKWRCTSFDRVFPDLLGLVALKVLVDQPRSQPRPSDAEVDEAVEQLLPGRRFALSLTVFPGSLLSFVKGQ